MTSIPQLHSCQELGHGIYLIDADYIRAHMAAVYLIVENRQIAIVETGTAHSVEKILTALHGLGFSTENVAYVIPTHVHLDHAGGAGHLIQKCPNATLVIHPRGARHMIDPARLVAGTTAVYGKEKFQALYGDVIPVDSDRVIEAPDDFVLDFNGRLLTFLDTPGHAKHHFCIYDKTSKGIFSGDTFGLCYRELDTDEGPFAFATTTPVQFDPQALLQSIDRLLSFAPDQIYLTHYGSVQPTTAYVAQLKKSIQMFTTIALDAAASKTDRQAQIESRLMRYLLDMLHKMHCPLSEETCTELLKTDVRLNAQGLEVWLNKQPAAL